MFILVEWALKYEKGEMESYRVMRIPNASACVDDIRLMDIMNEELGKRRSRNIP